MALLSVDNLSVSFRGRNGTSHAVRNLSFAVDKGQVLGIVGESGSGKSVTCLALLGLLPSPPATVDSGTAVFGNVDLLACNQQQLGKIRGNDIGMIFQDPMTSLNPYLTVGEQLIEPLLYHRRVRRAEARERGIRMLDEVGIRHPAQRFDSYPHQLSGGMRQRVMIAMALIAEPTLLICDEPTTALDVTIQAQILKLIGNIQAARHLTVIFISHDLAVVSSIANQLLVMQNGRLVESGTPGQIFGTPTQAYTRKLLAAIPRGGKRQVEVAAAPAPLLEVRQLRVWYPERDRFSLRRRKKNFTRAVDDISLTVGRNEILGVVGESGSGKSTLGRAIIGLTAITGGDVEFAGENISRLSRQQMQPFRRRLQMIFQDPYASLNPRMTVFETLAEPLLLHGLASKKTVIAQVRELMDQVGLAQAFVRKYPHEFSGGQRQRIAIGRAIATKPELVVADEPVSALDVTIQAQILQLLLDLVREHRLSMLFISHDLAVVRYIADRVAVMQQGKLVEQAATEQLWQQPARSYTKSLLAAIPKLQSGLQNA